jgi:hypothetical protein
LNINGCGVTFLSFRKIKKKKNVMHTITNRNKGLARGIPFVFIKLIENNEIYMMVPKVIVEI